jgi:hypothetical protein
LTLIRYLLILPKEGVSLCTCLHAVTGARKRMAVPSSRIRHCPRCKNPVESESQGCPSCGYLSPVARQQSAAMAPAPAPAPDLPIRRKAPSTVAALRVIGVLDLLGAVGLFVAAIADRKGALFLIAASAILTGIFILAVAEIVETLVNIESKMSSSSPSSGAE